LIAKLDDMEAGGCDSFELLRTYFQKHGRSRSYVTQPGAQCLPVWCQELLFPKSEDWDLVCAMPKILAHVVTRLSVLLDIPECKFDTVKEIATDRHAWARSSLEVAEDEGKDIINSTLAGKQLHPGHVASKPGLKRLIRESRVLRWLAVSVRTELFGEFIAAEKRWPGNTTLFYLWSPIEDYVNELATDRVMQDAVKHLSLHFDGVRLALDGERMQPAQRKEELEQYVFAKSGYVVSFSQKKHRTFLEWAALVGSHKAVQVDSELLRPGNGIPLALSFAFHEDVKELKKLVSKAPSQQHSEESMPVRQYLDWCTPKCEGMYRFEVMETIPLSECNFLMHVGGKGEPCCVCVKVIQAGSLYVVKHMAKDIELTPPLMFSLWKKCCDHKTIVLFKVTKAEGAQAVEAKSPLLKLSAC
jgi:hypothetical protein